MDIEKFVSVRKLCRRKEFHSEELCLMKYVIEFFVLDILFYIPLIFLAISFGSIFTNMCVGIENTLLNSIASSHEMFAALSARHFVREFSLWCET